MGSSFTIPTIDPASLDRLKRQRAGVIPDERVASAFAPSRAAQPESSMMRATPSVDLSSDGLFARANPVPSPEIQTDHPAFDPQSLAPRVQSVPQHQPGDASMQRAISALDAPTNPHEGQHVGIGERIMHGLKLGGNYLLRSGLNPIAGIEGLVQGAVDPGAWHEFKRAGELPNLVHSAQAAQELQGVPVERALKESQVTGQYNGQPTEPAMERRARIDETAAQNEAMRYFKERGAEAADRRATTGEQREQSYSKHITDITNRDQRKQALAERNQFLQRIAPNAPPDQVREAYRRQFNEELPLGFDARKHQLIDTGSTIESVPITGGGPSETVKGASGSPIPSGKAAQAAWSMQRTQALITGGMDREQARLQAQKEIADANIASREKIAQMPARAKSGARGGLLGIGGASAQSAPSGRKLSAADVKAYADRAYGGDTAKARARIAHDHPDWVLP